MEVLDYGNGTRPKTYTRKQMHRATSDTRGAKGELDVGWLMYYFDGSDGCGGKFSIQWFVTICDLNLHHWMEDLPPHPSDPSE